MEFVILVAFLVIDKLADTFFNYYQVKVQGDLEKMRIQHPQVDINADDSGVRTIGFTDRVEVEEED